MAEGHELEYEYGKKDTWWLIFLTRMTLPELRQTGFSRLVKQRKSVMSEPGYEEKRPTEQAKNWSDFKIAVPIALAFGVFFIALQKLGIVNLVSTSDVSYGTAFVVGIIASLKNSSKSGIFFKSAGLVVILFALFNIINSLVVIGVLSPIFDF